MTWPLAPTISTSENAISPAACAEEEHASAEARAANDDANTVTGETAVDKVSVALRHAIAQADSRQEVIAITEAHTIATLLATLFTDRSELRRLADTRVGNVDQLHAECQMLRRQEPSIPDLPMWLDAFESYLDARQYPEAEAEVHAALRRHGEALRAYLTLPDVHANDPELLADFQTSYIGVYPSMEHLLQGLTDLDECERELAEVAERYGFTGLARLSRNGMEALVRESWSIIQRGDLYYAFYL